MLSLGLNGRAPLNGYPFYDKYQHKGYGHQLARDLLLKPSDKKGEQAQSLLFDGELNPPSTASVAFEIFSIITLF